MTNTSAVHVKKEIDVNAAGEYRIHVCIRDVSAERPEDSYISEVRQLRHRSRGLSLSRPHHVAGLAIDPLKLNGVFVEPFFRLLTAAAFRQLGANETLDFSDSPAALQVPPQNATKYHRDDGHFD